MTTCPNGHEVPDGRFCVVCGEPLAADVEPGAGDRRVGFAAQPGERVGRPALISSLFPQLPRADMADFRLALGFGVVVVLVLAVAGLYPLGLVAAALLVPAITVVYLYDVDVYEDQPGTVTVFTLAWGAVAGVAVALGTSAALGSGGDGFTNVDQDLLARTVLIPVIGYVLVCVGPIALLLPQRRFNDVLDGAAFGAASAVAYAGALVIAYGFDVFGLGLRPDGDTVDWAARLFSIAILVPVLNMAVTGAAMAAVWLRFRAPVRDRAALGLLGSPLVALPLGAVLLVLAALGQRELPLGVWLLALLALDAVALLWLRRILHLGLMQESAEIPIGPEFTCVNCGARTARHSFCGNCGISLLALPKARRPDALPDAAEEAAPEPGGGSRDDGSGDAGAGDDGSGGGEAG